MGSEDLKRDISIINLISIHNIGEKLTIIISQNYLYKYNLRMLCICARFTGKPVNHLRLNLYSYYKLPSLLWKENGDSSKMCFEAVLEEICLALQRVTWFIIAINMIAMISAK